MISVSVGWPVIRHEESKKTRNVRGDNYLFNKMMFFARWHILTDTHTHRCLIMQFSLASYFFVWNISEINYGVMLRLRTWQKKTNEAVSRGERDAALNYSSRTRVLDDGTKLHAGRDRHKRQHIQIASKQSIVDN